MVMAQGIRCEQKSVSFSNIQQGARRDSQISRCLGRHFYSTLCSRTFATKETQVTTAELHHRMHHILRIKSVCDSIKTWKTTGGKKTLKDSSYQVCYRFVSKLKLGILKVLALEPAQERKQTLRSLRLR